MRTVLSRLIGVAAALGCALGVSAQVLPNPLPLPFPSFKWDQRYTPPRGTFTSKITACTQAQPAPLIALDDWVCTKPGPILRIGWWGWLSTTAQSQRPFYIAIYREDPNNPCRPMFPPVYTACVVPDQVKLVGKSCENVPGSAVTRPIYYLSAKLPTPFTQGGTPTNPQHFFLQISEIDAQSVQFGPEDFRWAGRRPIQVCNAMQFGSAAGFIQPILDSCDQQPDDLSFRLFSRGVTGTLSPNVKIPGAVTLRLFKPAGATTGSGDDVPEETVIFQFGAIDLSTNPAAVNTFTADFDSPDGVYILEVHAPGALPRRVTITLQDGVETDVGGVNIAMGDLNGDGVVNTIDLTLFLGSFGQSTP